MRMLQKIFSVFFILSLTGCAYINTPWGYKSTEGFQVPPGVEDIDSAELTSIVQDIAVEFKHHGHLQLQQAKTFFDMGINTIQLEFISQDIIELCEARERIVDLTEALLARLNQDPILGTQFASYPFRPGNLEIYITFESYFGRYIDPYYIHWIGLEDDMVTFYTFDVDDNCKFCWHHRDEPYATVREIVLYERQAEMKYDELHAPRRAVFGNQRYFPKD